MPGFPAWPLVAPALFTLFQAHHPSFQYSQHANLLPTSGNELAIPPSGTFSPQVIHSLFFSSFGSQLKHHLLRAPSLTSPFKKPNAPAPKTQLSILFLTAGCNFLSVC